MQGSKPKILPKPKTSTSNVNVQKHDIESTESNSNKTFIEQLFQTSSQSFDSSSSSSSSFNEVNACETKISKVQEIKKKMLAQTNLNQQNHSSIVINNRQHVTKTSRELEKVLGSRNDKNFQHNQKVTKSGNKFSKSFDENVTETNVSLQIHKKLAEEMKQQCEIIKEKFLLEKMPVQQNYNDYLVINHK